MKKIDMLVQAYNTILETEYRHDIIKCLAASGNTSEHSVETSIDAIKTAIKYL